MGNLALWGKEGNTAQNGGEFIFTRGIPRSALPFLLSQYAFLTSSSPDGKCTFAYRMKHTEDREHISTCHTLRHTN